MQTTPLKGVNLGGWLILERWMTPAVFEGTDAADEYTLSQTEKGRKAIKKHRDSFIKEADFIWLKENGINAVRLPVGYWAFKGDQSMLPHIKYVDWVMEMATEYDIKVLIDLHGLKGSQNGNDHSGKVGKADWFKNEQYRTDSLKTLEGLAQRYKSHPQLWGLQVINEPKVAFFHFKLRRFYRQAFELLSSILEPRTYIIFSDGFTPRLLSGAMGRSSQVIMDVHHYQATKIWAGHVSLERYYNFLIGYKKLLTRLSKKQAVIMGEWSGSLRQSVFDAVPQSQHSELVKQHCNKQLEAFEPAVAWFYWSYKTEKPGVWHFRSQVEEGIIEL